MTTKELKPSKQWVKEHFKKVSWCEDHNCPVVDLEVRCICVHALKDACEEILKE